MQFRDDALQMWPENPLAHDTQAWSYLFRPGWCFMHHASPGMEKHIDTFRIFEAGDTGNHALKPSWWRGGRSKLLCVYAIGDAHNLLRFETIIDEIAVTAIAQHLIKSI